MPFIRNMIGGAAIMAASLLLGILYNSVREAGMPLIMKMPPGERPAPASELGGLPPKEKPGVAARTSGEPGSSQETNASKKDAPIKIPAKGVLEEEHASLGEITIEKAKSLLQAEEAVFVDARGEKAYRQGHIPGAINIPYYELAEYYETLSRSVPREALVVCYCWSLTCDFSDHLARELRLMGYEKVVVFRGGWEEWQEAGYAGETVEKEE